MPSIKFVQCEFSSHGSAILAIFNDAILNSTALYENDLRTKEFMVSWFADKAAGNYPVIGIVEVDDTSGEEVLAGFATYGVFRTRPCYRFTIEHSVYVDKIYRGKGYGLQLLQEIIKRAGEQNYHVLVGVIDSSNSASIALHSKCGFSHGGTLLQTGFKFGRWLDTCFMQLVLKTPAIEDINK